MTHRYTFSATPADVVWAIVVAILIAAMSYYSGVSDAKREWNRELTEQLKPLAEEHSACAEALTAKIGKAWSYIEGPDGEYSIMNWDQ